MKKKIVYIILISSSLAVVVFVGGRIIIANDVSDEEGIFISKDRIDSDDSRILSTGADLGDIAAVTGFSLVIPVIILLSLLIVSILFFKILFIDIIPIRGPPGGINFCRI